MLGFFIRNQLVHGICQTVGIMTNHFVVRQQIPIDAFQSHRFQAIPVNRHKFCTFGHVFSETRR